MHKILPKAVRDLSAELMRLPNIGPKSARRLAIHLLRQPRSVVTRLGDGLKNLHANVRICQRCFNLSEQDICVVCSDVTRDSAVLCVVASPLDVEAIEKIDTYNGLYHVLGGLLSPLEGIGPDELSINELVRRTQENNVKEIIFALNPTVEGEATTRFITKQLDSQAINISRLGRGLPTGGDIEFADAVTISAAFESRKRL